MRVSRWVAVLLSLSACVGRVEQAESSSAESAPTGTGQPAATAMPISGLEYQEIHADSSPSLVAVGLCELVEGYDAGAGLYRVERIVVSDHRYVQLELLDSWSPSAPEHPVVILRTGDASVGEQLGVLLAGPAPDSSGALRLFQLGLFHDVGAGYTNGQLFRFNPVSAEHLGAVVQRAVETAGSPDCPDIQPEQLPEPEPPTSPDQVDGPEVEDRLVASDRVHLGRDRR